MAQKIQTLFIDDLDGSEAEGTVRFGLDGAEYEIDLNAEHAPALRDALASYVGAARRAGGGTRRPARGGLRGPDGMAVRRGPGPRGGRVARVRAARGAGRSRLPARRRVREPAQWSAQRPARGGRRARADGVDSTEVREWAKAQGIEVKDRGRVPAELMVKFKATTGQ